MLGIGAENAAVNLEAEIPVLRAYILITDNRNSMLENKYQKNPHKTKQKNKPTN